MTFHLRVQRWVAWWIGIGVVCGAIAIVNILGHNLTPVQDRILILLGVAHWLLGGIVCWAFKGVKAEPKPPAPPVQVKTAQETEYYPPSTFLVPGSRHTILPWRH
jgi:hypothetical protein